jgi:hypothetical protein
MIHKIQAKRNKCNIKYTNSVKPQLNRLPSPSLATKLNALQNLSNILIYMSLIKLETLFKIFLNLLIPVLIQINIDIME